MKIKFILHVLILTLSLSGTFTNAQDNRYVIKKGSDIIGQVFSVNTSAYANLSAIAKKYRIAYNKLLEANPLAKEDLTHRNSIKVPQQFILPKIRSGIVINLAQLRLFYFPPKDPSIVYSYPLAVGTLNNPTPETSTYIYEKIKNPTWTVPSSIINELDNEGMPTPSSARIPQGKYNPLGKYAMRLGESSYLIHGTNAQQSIGQYITHGCIRMYNKDIKELFSLVSTGIKVNIINQTIQLGRHKNNLLLSINYNPYTEDQYTDLDTIEYKIKKLLAQHPELQGKTNWFTIEAMIENSDSIPKKINSSAINNNYKPQP